ncbi:MAG: GNAT family N-acetyltransferase [Clostridium sp.]
MDEGKKVLYNCIKKVDKSFMEPYRDLIVLLNEEGAQYECELIIKEALTKSPDFLKLIPSNITNEMIKNFSEWEYNEKNIPNLSLEDIEQYMPEMFIPSKRDKEFIAYCSEIDSKFIGWCRGRCFNINGQDIIYLGYAINPNFQGLGLGKQMLKNAFVIFKKRYGIYPIMVDIEEENIRSIKLVESLGFRFLFNLEVDDCGRKIITKRFLLE